MREIKFRGKSINNGKWIHGSLVGTDVIAGGYAKTWDDDLELDEWEKVDPETVGQYTEMTDKNGKEIYEGDILKVPDLYETPENTSPTFHNEEVNYELGCFYSGGEPILEYWDYLSDESEVIGNIYENPELMEHGN